MTGLRFLLAATMLVVTAGCGTMDERGLLAPTVDVIAASAATRSVDAAALRSAVTPQFVASLPTSVAYFEALDAGVTAEGVLIHTVTSDPGRWSTPQGEVAFILRQGLPIRTHGFGVGLANADIDETLRALARGEAQTVTREMRFLDGQNHEIVRRFSCDFALEGAETITVFWQQHRTRRFVERCGDGQTSFENRYWRGQNGVLWRSETWLSPQFGMLRLERLSVVSRG